MAIVAEYLEQIYKSIAHLAFLMPPGSSLIVDQVFSTQGENTDLPEEIYEALPGEIIPENIYYYECYMLVQYDEDDPEKVYPLKEGMLSVPELEDLEPNQRAEFIEKWLMGPETDAEKRACDFLIVEEYEGSVVFVPNRFPIDLCHDNKLTTLKKDEISYAIPKAADVSFVTVLENTA